MDWRDDYEMTTGGRLRKKGHARDGDVVSFAFLRDGGDDMNRGDPGDITVKVVDAAGVLAGHRPGYAFVADDSVRDTSEQLHEQRKLDLAGRWRKQRKRKLAPQPQAGRWGKGGAFPASSPDGFDDGDDFDRDELAGLTLDELRTRAEQAREDRDQRLVNGPWREGRR